MAADRTERHPSATWSVAATVSEPAPLVIAFVAHALARGAAQVDVFLDAPDPALASMINTHERVRVTDCDSAWWRRNPGGRPWPAALRQRINLQSVLDAAPAHWVLHIDADEFLSGPADPGPYLAGLPDRIDHAIMPAIERVFLGAPDPDDIFAGRFRHVCRGAAQQAAIDRIDGPAAVFLRHGLAGYAGGKSFFRTGRGLRAGIHVPDDGDPSRMHHLTQWQLLHFDGLTRTSWVLKKQRKIAQQPEWRSFPDAHAATRNQLAALRAAGRDLRRQTAVHDTIKVLDPARAAALDALGLLSDARLDLRAEIAAAFPALSVDLSIAAFDAHAFATIPRRDLQSVKHGWRALVSRMTGRPPKP